MDKQEFNKIYSFANTLAEEFGNSGRPLTELQTAIQAQYPDIITGDKKSTNPLFPVVLSTIRAIAKANGLKLGAPRGRGSTWGILNQFLEDNSLVATSVSLVDNPALSVMKVDETSTFTVTFTAKKVEKKTTDETENKKE